MREHIANMKYLYGDNIHIQMPNDIFKTLSSNIKNKNGSTNVQQSSFAYAYLAIVSFLYKYAHFVDIDKETYIQNADIKELLRYSKTTKSIDSIIKKCGVLDNIGLTKTIKNYPTSFSKSESDVVNGINVREFMMIDDLDTNDINYNIIKKIVKNRNYEVKEPTFLFEYNEDVGTLYNYENTHKVTIMEIEEFLNNDKFDNIDLFIYFFFKSKCKGLINDSKEIGLHIITSELGISKDSFYSHLDKLKDGKLLNVCHRGWVMSNKPEPLEANEYSFLGI